MRSFILVLALASITACKHEDKAASKKYDEAQAKEKADVQAKLDSIAKLKDTVDKLKPADYKGKHDFTLNGEERKVNFDVLFAEQLADPTVGAPVYATHEPLFEGCAAHLKHKDGPYEYCNSGTCMSACANPKSWVRYLVVLRTRSIERPTTGTSSYTPGKLSADAFVFDLNDGNKFVGGGHIVADSSGQGTMSGTNARNDVEDAFGKAVWKAILAI